MDDTNKILFAFAAYNAGPGRIHSLREEAAKKGLNPNVWIDNVELVAAARIGMETVTYVASIYKYYIAYKLVAEREEERKRAKEALENGPQRRLRPNGGGHGQFRRWHLWRFYSPSTGRKEGASWPLQTNRRARGCVKPHKDSPRGRSGGPT